MALCIFLSLVFTRPFFNESSAPLATLANDAGLLAAAATLLFLRRKKSRPFGPVALPLALWTVAVIASALGNGGGSDGWERTAQTLLGTLLFTVPFFLTTDEKARLAKILFGAGVLIGCLGLYQAAFGFRRVEAALAAHALIDDSVRDALTAHRIFYPFIGANLLAGFLAMVAPLGILGTRRPWGLIPVAIALLLTRSIGAWAALFAGSTVVLLLLRRPSKKYLALIVIFVVGLAAVLGARIADPAATRHPVHSLLMRSEYGQDALGIIRQHPFLGTGLGSFDLPDARHAHNILLELWAETGLAGLMSFLLLAGIVFGTAVRRLRLKDAPLMLPMLLAAALIFFLHNLTDVSFFFPQAAFAGWLIAGLCGAAALETAPRPDGHAAERLS